MTTDRLREALDRAAAHETTHTCSTTKVHADLRALREALAAAPVDRDGREDHGDPDHPMKAWSQGFHAALAAVRDGDEDARRGVGWPAPVDRDGLREALRGLCASCHHPIGHHTHADGHPSGDMEPWCYCDDKPFLAALSAPEPKDR